MRLITTDTGASAIVGCADGVIVTRYVTVTCYCIPRDSVHGSSVSQGHLGGDCSEVVRGRFPGFMHVQRSGRLAGRMPCVALVGVFPLAYCVVLMACASWLKFLSYVCTFVCVGCLLSFLLLSTCPTISSLCNCRVTLYQKDVHLWPPS